MKDFKFIKTGNETIGPNWDKKRQLEDELRGWMTMVNKLDGDERRNAEKQIADIRKELNDVKIKIAHGENKKSCNESIDKQEWSLFKGLKKDAEKEVGNAISDYSVLTTKDGYFVYKKGQKVGGPFQNEEQAKAFAAQLQTKDPQWTNKTGNADTVSEYNSEIQRLTKKAEQLRRMGQGRSAMEIEKQIEKLGKELRELGNKKTGNAIPGSIASIGPAWMYGGTVYGKMDTDESGKKHNEYVKITWLGEGKGGVANYFIDDKMQSDKLGSLDKNELKRWAEQKVGNETKEADKVDNLKRARNAMAKNSQVTLWNGNDTALISEDGTVQYLESNSFEVDRDKYDSQEKAIEELTKKGYRKK